MYGLGFVHAQDRLWQLETHRRIGAGRLAEAFGAPALETDRFLRALGVRRAAAAQWAQASAESRAAILGLHGRRQRLPARARCARGRPSSSLLGLQPEPWTPEDSIAWAIMMAWDLGGNWSTELLRMRLALKLPVAAHRRAAPAVSRRQAAADAPTTRRCTASLKLDGKLGDARRCCAAPESGIEGVGSNNWVVARLAQRDRQAAARQRPAPEAQRAGAVVLRAPRGAGPEGRRRDACRGCRSSCWGRTSASPGASPTPAPTCRTSTSSASSPTIRRSTRRPTAGRRSRPSPRRIKVKGGADVALTVRATRHGPVISDVGRAPPA